MLQNLQLNASGFATSLVRRQASKIIGDLLAPLGPDGLKWLVEQDVPLASVLALADYKKPIAQCSLFLAANLERIKELSAPVEADYRKQAPTWKWAINALDHKTLWSIMPPWAQIILATEQGRPWWEKEVAWLMGLFEGNHGN